MSLDQSCLPVDNVREVRHELAARTTQPGTRTGASRQTWRTTGRLSFDRRPGGEEARCPGAFAAKGSPTPGGPRFCRPFRATCAGAAGPPAAPALDSPLVGKQAPSAFARPPGTDGSAEP